MPSLDEQYYRDEHLSVDLRDRVVILDGQILILTRTEYRLLARLVENAGKVVPRPILLMLTPTVDVHLWRLRRKLGAYADRYIETVFRVRYRFRQATQHPRQATSRVCRTSHAKAMRPASSFQPNMNTLRECGLSSPAVR